MRKIIVFSSVLMILFGVLSATLVGFARHLPQNARLFPLSDCPLPCFGGAVLGKTSTDETVQRISRTVEQRGYIALSSNDPYYRWIKTDDTTGKQTGAFIVGFQDDAFASLDQVFLDNDETPTLAEL